MDNLYSQLKYLETNRIIRRDFGDRQAKVLDVGCGSGNIYNYLENVEYYGLDGHLPNIKALKKKKIKHFHIDFNKEDFKFEERFDYVLLLDLLEHVADPGGLLEKSKRVVKPGGKMLISLPNDFHLLNKLRFILNKKLQSDPFWQYGHLHIFPISSAISFLQEHKLEILSKYYLFSEVPTILPNQFKSLLAKIFPNNFARGVLFETGVVLESQRFRVEKYRK